jgi:hypothetical protein|nr:MAG TPA: hypothetical protein [Caudoviricetes sp.]
MKLPLFKKKAEQMVSDTLLSGGVSVSIGSTEYKVYPPTLATWVEVSALIAQVTDVEERDMTLYDLIALGGDAETYAHILATFITGEKRDNEAERRKTAETLLYTATIPDLATALFTVLETMNVGELFMLTTSLKKTMITKPTKEVVNETTAPGHE